MIRNSEPKLNKEKAKQVILYLLNKLGPLTEEDLSYLLYFVDMDYFEKYEEHLMGFTCIKNED
jgi:hypothetical protein